MVLKLGMRSAAIVSQLAGDWTFDWAYLDFRAL